MLEAALGSFYLESTEPHQPKQALQFSFILCSFCSQRLSLSHSLNPFFLSFLLISLETLMLLFFLSLQKSTKIFHTIPLNAQHIWGHLSQHFKDRGQGSSHARGSQIRDVIQLLKQKEGTFQSHNLCQYNFSFDVSESRGICVGTLRNFDSLSSLAS